MGAPRDEKTRAELKKKVLEMYADTFDIKSACDAVGIHRRTWYDWRDSDEEFREGIEHARRVMGHNLEKVAIERAKAKSDILLIFMLKGMFPDIYKDRVESHVSHSTQKGDPGRKKLTDAQLDQLINLAQDAREKRKIDKLSKQNTPIPDVHDSDTTQVQ